MLTIFDLCTFGSVLAGGFAGTSAGASVGLAAAGGGLMLGLGVGLAVGLTSLCVSAGCMRLMFGPKDAPDSNEGRLPLLLGPVAFVVLGGAPIGSFWLADLTAKAVLGLGAA